MKRGSMKTEILRDKTVEVLDRITKDPWLDRACWIVMAIAACYFGAHVCAAFAG